MTEISESYLSWFLQRLIDLGKNEYFYSILGKPKKISELEIFLNENENEHKYGYFILGSGVVESSNITLDIEEDDVLQIMETFIPLTTDEEIENFKKKFNEEVENYKVTKADEEQKLLERIKGIIPKIDSEQQKEIFNILKDSYKLKEEALYKKVDKVYLIVQKRETAVELFKLIRKSLKGYLLKNRNILKTTIERKEEEEE